MRGSAHQKRRRGLVVALLTLLFGTLLVGGLVAAPASATDQVTNTPTLSASQDTQSYGRDKGCPGDVCQQIPWCKHVTKPSGVDGLTLSDTSPEVVVPDGKKGGGEQDCIKPLQIKHTKGNECCTTGHGKIVVSVYNPNPQGVKIPVQVVLGNEKPQYALIDGGSTKYFVFDHLSNGTYKLTVNVVIHTRDGKVVYCQVYCDTVCVDCKHESPSPSPSESTSESASPSPSTSESSSPSASPSQSTQPAGNVSNMPSTTPVANSGSLPVTGTPLTGIVLGAAVLLAGGAVLLVATRRRRAHQQQ